MHCFLFCHNYVAQKHYCIPTVALQFVVFSTNGALRPIFYVYETTVCLYHTLPQSKAREPKCNTVRLKSILLFFAKVINNFLFQLLIACHFDRFY